MRKSGLCGLVVLCAAFAGCSQNKPAPSALVYSGGPGEFVKLALAREGVKTESDRPDRFRIRNTAETRAALLKLLAVLDARYSATSRRLAESGRMATSGETARTAGRRALLIDEDGRSRIVEEEATPAATGGRQRSEKGGVVRVSRTDMFRDRVELVATVRRRELVARILRRFDPDLLGLE